MSLAKKTRKQGFVFVHLQLYIYCLPTSKIWLINKLSLCTFIPNNISLAERWLITTPRLLHHLITSAQKLWVIRQETKRCSRDSSAPSHREHRGDEEIPILFKKSLVRDTQRQLSENMSSEDGLRSRIFGTFVVKFFACLPHLGHLKTAKKTSKNYYNCPFFTDFYP